MIDADAYLFDIDGTLLNVRDATHYFAFLNAMREVFNLDCNLDGVPIHGNSDVGILRAALRLRGVSDELFDSHIQRVIDQMCAEVLRSAADIRAEICPGVAELLRQFQSAGKLLGVATGNMDAIGWAKLQAADVRHYFSFGAFSAWTSQSHNGSGPPLRFEKRVDIFRFAIEEARRRLGGKASVCAIGDTPSDVEAARELGIPVIAVASGTYTREQLQAAGPDMCVSCCGDLLNNTL